jgi:hypothetical protein
MSMVEEVNLARALHTIVVTMNDQKLDDFDAERVQELATGSMGGEQKLIAYGNGTRGELREGSVDGPAVARFTYVGGEWSVERVPAARKSEDLQQFEQQREQQTKTEYQKPIRGRLAIWKKRLSG